AGCERGTGADQSRCRLADQRLRCRVAQRQPAGGTIPALSVHARSATVFRARGLRNSDGHERRATRRATVTDQSAGHRSDAAHRSAGHAQAAARNRGSVSARLPLSYPAAVLVAAAALSPIVVLLLLSVGADIDLGARAVDIAVNTILLTLLTTAMATLIGVVLAFLTTYVRLPGARVVLVALAAPLAVPSYLGAFAFFAAFGTGGTIDMLTGLPTPRVHGLWG